MSSEWRDAFGRVDAQFAGLPKPDAVRLEDFGLRANPATGRWMLGGVLAPGARVGFTLGALVANLPRRLMCPAFTLTLDRMGARERRLARVAVQRAVD